MRAQASLGKNLGGKSKKLPGRIFPGIRGKIRLPASLLEKPLAVPATLAGHLRQQQPAPVAHHHQQSVPSDFNFFRLHWDRVSEDGNFNLQF